MNKERYLKYKNKYLELKYKNHNGGLKLKPTFDNYYSDQTTFIDWYISETKNNLNSTQIFKKMQNLLSMTEQQIIFNIIIGCTCLEDNDYYRFKDSEVYSLYIDNRADLEEAINIEDRNYPEKQYNMYSINYDHFKDDIPNFINENSIDSIHFDTGVSYLAPIRYLDLAEYCLKIGGKIIWDLLDHAEILLFYENGKFTSIGSIDVNKIIKDFENNFIIVDEKNKVIKPSDNRFFENNSISPQLNLGIEYYLLETRKNMRFEKQLDDNFLDYCKTKFKKMSFEIKTYSLANYTYPAPIRIIKKDDIDFTINVYNNVINFIINDIMTYTERKTYVEQKKIDKIKLMNLLSNINIEQQKLIINEKIIPLELLEANKTETGNYNFSTFLFEFIWSEFTKEMKYIEATKIL